MNGYVALPGFRTEPLSHTSLMLCRCACLGLPVSTFHPVPKGTLYHNGFLSIHMSAHNKYKALLLPHTGIIKTAHHTCQPVLVGVFICRLECLSPAHSPCLPLSPCPCFLSPILLTLHGRHRREETQERAYIT